MGSVTTLQEYMDNDWPFPDPRNLAVITTARVIREGRPVLLVAHDDDGGSWQFLDGRTVTVEDALVVGLGEIVAHDPTLRALADLPRGWRAQRAMLGERWQRYKG